jgi:hypothetical protein
MDIYQPTEITEKITSEFEPTRLAIKKLAGQYYFCKSTKQDFMSYPGSGVVWKKRIKKYGKAKVETLWVSDWYHCPHEIQEVALQFSKENQVVESKLWANIVPENGLRGGRVSPESIEKNIATRRANGTLNPSTPESVKKMVETKRKNGTMNSNTPETVAKAIATRKKNGTLNPNTLESRQKAEETKRRNGTHSSSTEIQDKILKTRMAKASKYSFIHESGIKEYCTVRDLSKKYNLYSSNLYNMTKQKKGMDSVKGWSLVKPETSE